MMPALQKFLDSFFLPLLVGLALALIGLLIYQKRRRDGKSTRGIWFGILVIVLLSAGASYFLARRPDEKPDLVIAGRVVDAITNNAISGAKITLSGRTETMFSESNGNFRLELSSKSADLERVPLVVDEAGYQQYREGYLPGTHGITIALKKVGH